MSAARSWVSSADFRWFRDFFYERTGIAFDESKRYFVDRRLEARAKATGASSLRAYFSLLQGPSHQGELQELVNIMTVNETYFFREDYQFKCMTTELMDQRLADRKDGAPLRIWSMPCSTGEEPYSIAIYLLESWSRIDDVDVEIVGSDIDSGVLARARAGLYDKRAVHKLTPTIIQRYFTTGADDRYQVKPELRDAINFTTVNLNDRSAVRNMGQFDVVYCRNLLIYFNDASRRVAAETLYGALKPGGFLFLGHSESMSRISSALKVHWMSGTLVYQRPL